MPCTRNVVFEGIASQVTAFLQAAFHGDAKCYRDFKEMDPNTIGPGGTPAVWIVEGPSEVFDANLDHNKRMVKASFQGLVMTGGNVPDPGLFEGHIPYYLNELEAVLDRCLTEVVRVQNASYYIAVSIHPDGEVTPYAGEDIGALIYPVRVEFTRLAGGS